MLKIIDKIHILSKSTAMKVVSSIRSLKKRHRDCRIIKRNGRIYVINKAHPRFKACQG